MPAGRYHIKVMTPAEVNLAVEWAAQEGWNPGLQDAACYLQADPQGFLMGYLDDQPIASISVVRYSQDFGFLGFYIVKPEYRGQGYGLRLWQAGMDYLKDCKNVALDGVVAQQDNYKKSGFELAYSNIRYAGVGGGVCPEQTAVEILPLAQIPFEQLAVYDHAFFPVARQAFLRAWIHQPNAVALGLIQQGVLVGYGVMRPCREGYKVAPLFADSASLAELLFCALKAQVPAGVPIFLDVPEVNPAAVSLAENHNMQRVFETARMYTGGTPDLAVERTFGVTSFEIG